VHVRPNGHEAHRLVDADRAPVERRDGQDDWCWAEARAGLLKARLDEPTPEANSGQVGTKAESDLDRVRPARLELEEAGELT